MTAVRDQLTIRPAQAGDLARVAEIYNVGIAERVATFETSPRTLDDIRSWVDDGQPFIVAIDDDEVIGWARAGAYSDRCVYEGVGEHAVYVHPNARGRGLGHTLLTELCAESRTTRALQAHQPCVHRQRTQPSRAPRRRIRRSRHPTTPRQARRAMERLRPRRTSPRPRRRLKLGATDISSRLDTPRSGRVAARGPRAHLT